VRVNAPSLGTAPRHLFGAFVPGDARILYLADPEDADADELYVTNALALPSLPNVRPR
jgi:hypothetical protein